MTVRHNTPDIAYLINTSTPDGQHLCYFRIEQALGSRKGADGMRSNYNVVQSHLHGLSETTGLCYEIEAWGPPSAVGTYCLSRNIIIH